MLPIPLSVRLRTAARDVHITDQVADLAFSATSPGGYEACTLTLHRPISFTPGEVAQFGLLYVYDARSGATVWEGRLQDPGRSAGTDGETYQLAAIGGSAHLQDITQQYIAVDNDPTHYQRWDTTTPASQVDQFPDLNDTGVAALQLRIPQGTDVTSSSRAVAANWSISEAGHKLARVGFTWDAGLTASTLQAQLYAYLRGAGTTTVAFSTNFTTTGGTVTRVIATDWADPRNVPMFRLQYNGGTGTVNADTWWLQITGIAVRTTQYTAAGSEKLTAASYTTNTVLASDVVADLLGRRHTTTLDGANATISATSYGIDNLTYLDGATSLQVLDDLVTLEQAYTWHVWESNPDNGRFRFEWVPWPTIVRYEADVIDGFSAPASGNTIFDKARVRRNDKGTLRVTERTQVVPALAAAGFSRTAFIDLGDNISSEANAIQVGDQFLAEHRYPVNGGRLTVRRPIVDYETGRMVQPWEIRPGNLVRVRGVAAYPDSLNASGRDGVTVFKVAATSYSASESAATLDLDTFTPSVARALAKLGRNPVVRRR